MSVALALAAGAAGVVVWSARLRVLRSRSRVAPAAPPATRLVPVSIIVPARGEAGNLPALLESIALLRPAPLEVIVVDGHSADARQQRYLGPFPRWSGLVYPVFVGVFVVISVAAAAGRVRGAPVVWKGRTIRT